MRFPQEKGFNMIHKLLPLTLAVCLAGPALASDSLKLDADTEAQIRTTLTEDGYDVRKIEVEDGMYEAYATKDGHKYEVFLDASLTVVKIEED